MINDHCIRTDEAIIDFIHPIIFFPLSLVSSRIFFPIKEMIIHFCTLIHCSAGAASTCRHFAQVSFGCCYCFSCIYDQPKLGHWGWAYLIHTTNLRFWSLLTDNSSKFGKQVFCTQVKRKVLGKCACLLA